MILFATYTDANGITYDLEGDSARELHEQLREIDTDAPTLRVTDEMGSLRGWVSGQGWSDDPTHGIGYTRPEYSDFAAHCDGSVSCTWRIGGGQTLRIGFDVEWAEPALLRAYRHWLASA